MFVGVAVIYDVLGHLGQWYTLRVVSRADLVLEEEPLLEREFRRTGE